MCYCRAFYPTGSHSFTVTLLNTGNVKWSSGAALTSTPDLSLTCLPATPSGAPYEDPTTNTYASPTYELLVGHKVSCSGSFDFTQAVFESVSGGTKNFSITLPTVTDWTYTKSGGSASGPTTLAVTVTVTQSFSAVIGTCSLPLNATSRFLHKVVMVPMPSPNVPVVTSALRMAG